MLLHGPRLLKHDAGIPALIAVLQQRHPAAASSSAYASKS